MSRSVFRLLIPIHFSIRTGCGARIESPGKPSFHSGVQPHLLVSMPCECKNVANIPAQAQIAWNQFVNFSRQVKWA
jgi:hypothetical protein